MPCGHITRRMCSLETTANSSVISRCSRRRHRPQGCPQQLLIQLLALLLLLLLNVHVGESFLLPTASTASDSLGYVYSPVNTGTNNATSYGGTPGVLFLSTTASSDDVHDEDAEDGEAAQGIERHQSGG